MKAICVTPDRELEVRDVPTPDAPAAGHVLIDMDASAINHGDKTFLKMPGAAGPAAAPGRHAVWGHRERGGSWRWARAFRWSMRAGRWRYIDRSKEAPRVSDFGVNGHMCLTRPA